MADHHPTSLEGMSLKELDAVQAKLDRAREAAQNKHLAEIRHKIDDILEKYDLSLRQVYGKKAPLRLYNTPKRKNPPLAAKYVNPKDPNETWAGRGNAPRWFRQALEDGHKETSMLINQESKGK